MNNDYETTKNRTYYDTLLNKPANPYEQFEEDQVQGANSQDIAI